MNKQNMSKIPEIFLVGLTAFLIYPSIASAFNKYLDLPKLQINLLSLLFPALLVLGVVLFVCGLVKYIIDFRHKNKKTIAKWLLFSGVFISIATVTLWWFIGYIQPNLGLTESIGGRLEQPPVQYHPILVADVTQNPILLGASHNIFVGKVLAQTGTTESPAGIRTQYSVEIVSNIKGNLEGTVTVEQEGGLKNGVLQTIEDAFPLLEVGSTYILATRYNESANAYTVIANENAGKLLSNNVNLSHAVLQTLIDKDEKVKSLEAAYPNEVLLEADIAHNNTRNSFQSLPTDKKAAAQSRADTAKVSLEANIR
jgi:hypothetical protein